MTITNSEAEVANRLGFKIIEKNEGGYKHFNQLVKNNWCIWQIKEGYQAAKLVNGSYKYHYCQSFQEGLSDLIIAMNWVEKQIEELM